MIASKSILKRRFLLPAEHGAWIFLLSPLLIGLVLGQRLTPSSGLLVLAVLAAFLLRQPLTILVKILVGRRPRSELAPALFWAAVYSLAGLVAVLGLVLRGDQFLFWLAIPAIPAFAWHLWLVSRRAERQQMAVELAGSAALALAAPAAYWVGKGSYDPAGWLIWGLSWLQTAGSIFYAYLRLKQRRLQSYPDISERLSLGKPAVLFNSVVLLLFGGLALLAIIPPWVPAAFAVQWIEVLWGTFNPAIKMKPAWIGTRQLVVSCLFTALFILAWMSRVS